MKFVIHKGVSGFADRLQSLMSVIKYSVKTNRILVVDWSDEEWCTDEKYDFYAKRLDGNKDFTKFLTGNLIGTVAVSEEQDKDTLNINQ